LIATTNPIGGHGRAGVAVGRRGGGGDFAEIDPVAWQQHGDGQSLSRRDVPRAGRGTIPFRVFQS